MAYLSNATTISGGVTANVAVPFPYLDQAHVHVTLDGVAVDDSTITWASSGVLTLAAIPTAGVAVKVYRQTPNDQLATVFSTPTTFDPRDLNRLCSQLLYVTQEAFDLGAVNEDALESVLEAIMEATAAAEAAKDAAEEALADLNATLAAAVAAAISAANGFASAASGSATEALGFRNTASTHATNAGLSAAAAALSAASLDTSAFALKATALVGGGLAVASGNLGATPTITVPGASQAEAEAGSDNAKLMTPLRTKQALDALRALASQAEAEAGIDNTKLMTALRVDQAVEKHFYVSSDQTITLGSLYTLAHGLGARPRQIDLRLVCQATDGGWVAGDILNMPSFPYQFNGSNCGCQVYADATNIYVRVHSGSSWGVVAKSTGSTSGAVTNSAWKFKVEAFK